MPVFVNKLPGALSIEGAGGHTYHIDGSQSIEITDADVVAMRDMGAFKLLEERGSVVIEGAADSEAKDEGAAESEAKDEGDPEAPPRRRVRKPKPRGDAD